MADSRKRPLSTIRSGYDHLEDSRQRTAAAIEETAEDLGVDPDDSLRVLEEIVAEVQSLLEGSRDAGSGNLFSNALTHEITHLLRKNILDRAESAESAIAVIDVLRALEELHAPQAGGELYRGSGDHALELRLRAPDAFKLLVEVAHDFRSPLTSILFLSEALRDGHSGPVTRHQMSQLGLIYSAAFGLAAIASDVIDLARNEQDLIHAEPEPYSIAELFASVERLVEPIVQEKGIELRIELPTRSTASGNPHALSRVLLNLATNALKHTDEGFVAMGVQHRPRNQLEFYVSDTGRGIPEAERDDLFKPFKRRPGELGGEVFSGSGIGLSIVRRLVRAMGSELEFDSAEDQGSRFWFVVPADG